MAKTPAPDTSEWDLPRLRASFSMQDDWKNPVDDQAAQEFFDVKFYPYNPIDVSAVFAACSKKHVVVCRLHEKEKDKNPCEIIQVIRDDDGETTANCTCTWTKNPENNRPWLCIAGTDAKVKVYDIVDGTKVTTLVGHGGGINDLTTSPANPWIIASASDDTTVRIWSLETVHAKQPCVCILGGEGHMWDLLSVAFHDTGRHVLSAGHDQVINLWTIPELPNEHVDSPKVVHYPHFSTTEIHNNLVDCVAFFGDLILSRACHEDTIVLWRIEGFNSDNEPLGPLQAPTTYDPTKQTRSAFASTLPGTHPAQFTRLLQFATPDCTSQFFMRFRMFHAPGKHPILCFNNAKSKTLFWDMSRFSAYDRFMEELRDYAESPDPKALPPPDKPAWLQVKKNPAPKKTTVVGTSSSLRFGSTVNGGGGGNDGGDREVSTAALVSASPDPDSVAGLGGYNKRTLDEWAELYDITNSHRPIKPHRIAAMEGTFVGRQVAWSPEGDWCVVVGNFNRVLIYQRWPKDMKKEDSRSIKDPTPAMSVAASVAASVVEGA
ncbi:WD40-repeat-containing domain protein [Apodospora peruviana]|uniref:WD40-repeat-containing domain protein n=1 Tax=Apodospora peruviana TaxID=516989 RepID=A0AAE0I4P1_9PEZI|nr:WD40-repeat-containing domain protein [Apodospora peruviana]